MPSIKSAVLFVGVVVAVLIFSDKMDSIIVKRQRAEAKTDHELRIKAIRSACKNLQISDKAIQVLAVNDETAVEIINSCK